MTATLGAAGIALPPPADQGLVRVFGPWNWGSRRVRPFRMYKFDIEWMAGRLARGGNVFALNHAGHGINSHGLNLVTGAGSVCAFVQHLYGGAYTDPVSQLVRVNATYSRLRVLLKAVQRLPPAEPRWLLLYSDFRLVTELVDLDRLRAGARLSDASTRLVSEPALFEEVVKVLRLEDGDFGTFSPVSW